MYAYIEAFTVCLYHGTSVSVNGRANKQNQIKTLNFT